MTQVASSYCPPVQRTNASLPQISGAWQVNAKGRNYSTTVIIIILISIITVTHFPGTLPISSSFASTCSTVSCKAFKGNEPPFLSTISQGYVLLKCFSFEKAQNKSLIVPSTWNLEYASMQCLYAGPGEDLQSRAPNLVPHITIG